MITSAPTREIVKQFRRAGFTKRDGKGSHSMWTCAHGRYSVSVDTGHRTISPGVRRQIDNAINQCRASCGQED